MNQRITLILIIVLAISSCASKKDIYYMQDLETQENSMVMYTNSLIQPNDVLRITVSALNPETAEIFNQQNAGGAGGGGGMSGGMLALTGYLVSPDYTINFPILGKISVKNMTANKLADNITKRLVDGSLLKNPTVDVRLVNAKFTIIGEASGAQTINFSEQNITLIQALGMAGGLDINTIRKDVKILREEKGIRQVTNVDLTQTNWMNGPYYFIKPNDVIVVKPNNPAVKQAGFISNPSSLIGILGALSGLIFLIISSN